MLDSSSIVTTNGNNNNSVPHLRYLLNGKTALEVWGGGLAVLHIDSKWRRVSGGVAEKGVLAEIVLSFVIVLNFGIKLG